MRCVCCDDQATRQDLSGEWWCEDCPDECMDDIPAPTPRIRTRRQEAVRIAKAMLCHAGNHEFCRHKETK